jgi:hypothetical protein
MFRCNTGVLRCNTGVTQAGPERGGITWHFVMGPRPRGALKHPKGCRQEPLGACKGPQSGLRKTQRRNEKDKVFMVIGSLCPISVEGVIRGLRWGISPVVEPGRYGDCG